jgi:hypothetical protein
MFIQGNMLLFDLRLQGSNTDIGLRRGSDTEDHGALETSHPCRVAYRMRISALTKYRAGSLAKHEKPWRIDFFPTTEGK